MDKLDTVLVILVQNLKETVTLMTNVKKVSDVDQTIALFHLDLMHIQIAVMMQLLEMRIFAQLMNLVKQMKVTAIPITNAKAICFVDQTIVLIHLDFYLQLTAVSQKVTKYYLLLCFNHCPYTGCSVTDGGTLVLIENLQFWPNKNSHKQIPTQT